MGGPSEQHPPSLITLEVSALHVELGLLAYSLHFATLSQDSGLKARSLERLEESSLVYSIGCIFRATIELTLLSALDWIGISTRRSRKHRVNDDSLLRCALDFALNDEKWRADHQATKSEII